MITSRRLGWFIDPTPPDDSEFTTPGNQGEQNRMDLLSVLMHEVGQLVGYEHWQDGERAALHVSTAEAVTQRCALQSDTPKQSGKNI